MRKFDIVKTAQLVIYIALAAIALVMIFRDERLYHAIASDASVRGICVVLWALLVLSLGFLLYDLRSVSVLRNENIELDYAVNSDPLTGLANRRACDSYLAGFADVPAPAGTACVTMVVSGLREINAARGRAGGDEALQTFSHVLADAAGDGCFLGRNGGNKFLAIFDDVTQDGLDDFLAAVARGVPFASSERSCRPTTVTPQGNTAAASSSTDTPAASSAARISALVQPRISSG